MTDAYDLNPTFSARFNSGDADLIADLYEEHAVFHGSSGPVIGRDAIRAYYADMVAASPTMDSRSRRVLVTGDLALITSDWTFTSDSGSTSGVSVEVVRRQPDGAWRYVLDEPKVLR